MEKVLNELRSLPVESLAKLKEIIEKLEKEKLKNGWKNEYLRKATSYYKRAN